MQDGGGFTLCVATSSSVTYVKWREKKFLDLICYVKPCIRKPIFEWLPVSFYRIWLKKVIHVLKLKLNSLGGCGHGWVTSKLLFTLPPSPHFWWGVGEGKNLSIEPKGSQSLVMNCNEVLVFYTINKATKGNLSHRLGFLNKKQLNILAVFFFFNWSTPTSL